MQTPSDAPPSRRNGTPDHGVRRPPLVARLKLVPLASLAVLLPLDPFLETRCAHAEPVGVPLRIVSREETAKEPPMRMACPADSSGNVMVGLGAISTDGGTTWRPFAPKPDYAANLPYGYRRESSPAILDHRTGRVVLAYNALDTPGIDPNAIEPPGALEGYYLRYRVSEDGGKTWLFDEPLVVEGQTPMNPIAGVWKGKNGAFLGDVGSTPIVTGRGELLLPVQVCLLAGDGSLASPGGGFTYHDVVVCVGKWRQDRRIAWTTTARVTADPRRSTRGLFEPTLAEFPDGRILMVMRGSNERGSDYSLPGYKWCSVSCDGGRTWDDPTPWGYAEGAVFSSPSSMSQLIRHSSGRVFWIGNIVEGSVMGNSPRWPLLIGEVDPVSLRLMKRSLVMLDTRLPTDPPVVDLSHFRAQEDLRSAEIVLTVLRALHGYKSTSWTTYRLALHDSN